MKKLGLALLAAMITTFTGSAAHATIFNFDVIYWEGSDNPPATIALDGQAHFQLDDTQASAMSNTARFNVSGQFFGYQGDAVIDLFPGWAGGGLDMLPEPGGDPDWANIRELWGDAVFSGARDAPVIHTGVYDMGDYGERTGTYRVTISDAIAGVVPEPASWALMIVGFGMAGAMLRRRNIGVRIG
jgi:hypothetical protein